MSRREDAGTSMLAYPVPEFPLRDLMGHAPGSRVTKRHYDWGSREEVKAAAEALWEWTEVKTPVAA